MSQAVHTLDMGPADAHQPSAEKASPAVPARKTMLKPKKAGGAARKAAKQAANATPAKKGRRIHVRADLASGGSLHVRQMAAGDAPVRLDGVSVSDIALDDKDAGPVWIQIAKPGTFKGHYSGPFELNEKVFADIIANFKATPEQHVPIDFEHASEAPATEGSIPVVGAPAQGWIVDMKVEGGNLYALVEWGDLAREYIRTKKYKYFSPAIRFNARDRVTGANIGARLTSGALTNNPFLTSMRPLAASDRAGASVTLGTGLAHAPCEYMPRLRYILRVDELASADDCLAKLARLEELLDKADGDPMASPEGATICDLLFDLREFVRAVPGDTWDDVFGCVRDLLEQSLDEAPESSPDLTLTDAASDEASANETSSAGESVGLTDTQETLPMDPKELAELNVKLSTAEARVADASTKLSASEAKAAELSLSLKEETAKREAAEVELKQLRADKAEREVADAKARVDEAFDTYKDKKALTDDDREAMAIVLKANPERFEKLYPRVQPSEKHLLRDLTTVREPPAKTTDLVPVTSARAAARKLAAERGIPLADAQNIVMSAAASR